MYHSEQTPNSEFWEIGHLGQTPNSEILEEICMYVNRFLQNHQKGRTKQAHHLMSNFYF